MTPEQEALERAQLLHALDMLICIVSLPELPEIHLDSVQKWNGKPPPDQIKQDRGVRRCVECGLTKAERQALLKSSRDWRRRRCRECLMFTRELAAEALDRFWHDQPQHKGQAA